MTKTTKLLRLDEISAAGRVLAAIPCARRDPWALGTRSDEGAVLVVYGRNWPSVPVPSITTNTRFGSAARHALLAVISNVCPLFGACSLSGHLGPARTAGPFSISGGRGGNPTVGVQRQF